MNFLISALLHNSLGIARQTTVPVNTNEFPTAIAGPALIFISDELPNPFTFDMPEILYHAHTIFFAISSIQVLQSLTGEGLTGMITVFTLPLCTVTQDTLPAAFCIWSETAIASVPGPYKSDAKTAVHSAWGYIRYFGAGFHSFAYAVQRFKAALIRSMHRVIWKVPDMCERSVSVICYLKAH